MVSPVVSNEAGSKPNEISTFREIFSLTKTSYSSSTSKVMVYPTKAGSAVETTIDESSRTTAAVAYSGANFDFMFTNL